MQNLKTELAKSDRKKHCRNRMLKQKSRLWDLKNLSLQHNHKHLTQVRIRVLVSNNLQRRGNSLVFAYNKRLFSMCKVLRFCIPNFRIMKSGIFLNVDPIGGHSGFHFNHVEIKCKHLLKHKCNSASSLHAIVESKCHCEKLFNSQIHNSGSSNVDFQKLESTAERPSA